jgi:thiosulfate/3-mercaptopyruvate sulfurtransferase
MSIRILFYIAALIIFVLGLPSFGAAQAAAHPEMIVSTQWLADHLNDPNVVILQIGQNKAQYDEHHIPGARYLDFDDFMVDHDGIHSELPAVDKLKGTFEKLGVSDNSHVVLYTLDWYPMAARGYYTLDYLGHGEKTSLLDGGYQQWKAENRPLSTDPVTPARTTFTPHVNENVRALLEEAQAVSQDGSGKAVLVDSRPPKRYRDGHLPGATNVYWKETIVDEDKSPVFLPPDQLRALFKSRGITDGEKLVTYCEIGWQASHVYFVAKYLGYNDAMYDGSFNEWSGQRHLNVVKGAKPK